MKTAGTHRYTYDKKRHHLTATDRRAVSFMLERLGDCRSIGTTTGRNKYSLSMDLNNTALLTVQNNEGQYMIPLQIAQS